MYIEVTPFEAARILARGGHIWDGCDPWACCLCGLVRPPKKARQLRALTRKLAGPWNVDGWWIYKKEG